MIPYMASLGWYAAGITGREAVPERGRWNRAYIDTAAGGGMLSVPVRGGTGALRHADPETLEVDDSRNWRHVHLGAINAAYSRTPYYQHFAPEVLATVGDRSLTRLADIAAGIDAAVRRHLHLDAVAAQIASADAATRLRLAGYAAQYEAEASADAMRLSALHYLFRYGPDAIFLVARPLLS